MDCRRVSLIGFTLVLAAAALLHGATADTFIVLEGLGWSIPVAGNDSVYRAWAAGKDFEVGDVLVFNFATGFHDVTKVTQTNYQNCGKANPINTVTNGPANITLTTAGMHYFICTVGTHCNLGQKLAVNVTADSDTRTPPATGTPPATTSPPGTTTPATPPSTSTTPTPPTTTTSSPPPPSSASSITFGGFSAAILSMVLVFLH